MGILELQEARRPLSRARPKCGRFCLSIGQSERMALGEKVHLNFLTPEGQIRAEAIVRHVRPERLGLKFIAVSAEDRTHLTALMTRLRSLSRPPPKS
jgi:PilZ domain